MMYLEEILAKLYDKANRTQKASANRTVRTWVLQEDTIFLFDEVTIDPSSLFPHVWAEDGADPQPADAYWDLGYWAEDDD